MQSKLPIPSILSCVQNIFLVGRALKYFPEVTLSDITKYQYSIQYAGTWSREGTHISWLVPFLMISADSVLTTSTTLLGRAFSNTSDVDLDF